jgi:hypothetical protein
MGLSFTITVGHRQRSHSQVSPAGRMTKFYCLRFETPQPGRPGPRIYILQEEGGPVTPPGTCHGLHRKHRVAQQWLACL